MIDIDIQKLVEAGLHFGHNTDRWNPKMAKYIYTKKFIPSSRSSIHIINLQKTKIMLEEAYKFLYDMTLEGGDILFLGTKKQSKDSIKHYADLSGSYYINERWMGGTFTNFQTIRKLIRSLKQYERQDREGYLKQLPNKEVIKIKKLRYKFNHFYYGIKDMFQIPKAIFVTSVIDGEIAIREAKRMGVKVIALCDSNANPDLIDYIIPGNDDAYLAIAIVLKYLSDAIIQAKIEKGDMEKSTTEDTYYQNLIALKEAGMADGKRKSQQIQNEITITNPEKTKSSIDSNETAEPKKEIIE